MVTTANAASSNKAVFRLHPSISLGSQNAQRRKPEIYGKSIPHGQHDSTMLDK
jgi:hypothetical protein